MATRLYLSRELRPPGQVVTPNAGWEKTTGALLARLEARKQTGFGASTTSIAANGTSGNDTLLGQWISSPLDSNQNIGGGGATFRGQMRFNESSASLDARVQCIVYVIQSDLSTVRGTILAMDASALSHEFNTSLRNISIPLGGSQATTLVAAQTGDMIVVEIGFRQHATFSASGVMSTQDSAGTDLAVDETTTTANDPWVEFSDTITFSPGDMVATQSIVAVLYTPANPNVRATQTAVAVLYSESFTASAGNAAGTGAAANAAALLAPSAGLASGSGAAYDATAAVLQAASAGLASGTGAASGTSMAVAGGPGFGDGSGAAFDAVIDFNVSAVAGAAAGSGTASGATTSIVVAGGLGSGTGTAYDAVAQVGSYTDASAGLASGTGAASTATSSIKTGPGAATSTGAALAATVTASTLRRRPTAGRHLTCTRTF